MIENDTTTLDNNVNIPTGGLSGLQSQRHENGSTFLCFDASTHLGWSCFYWKVWSRCLWQQFQKFKKMRFSFEYKRPWTVKIGATSVTNRPQNPSRIFVLVVTFKDQGPLEVAALGELPCGLWRFCRSRANLKVWEPQQESEEGQCSWNSRECSSERYRHKFWLGTHLEWVWFCPVIRLMQKDKSFWPITAHAKGLLIVI